MPELLITRVQDVKVLETTVEEKMRFQVRLTLMPTNNVINDMDFNFATKKAATKRIKQAVAEPTMARFNSFRPDSTRSPRSVMEQRRVSQTGTRG